MIEPYWTSKDGRFVIYCGDCLEVMPTLGKVDAVVTDPPYGIKDAPIQGQERTGKRTGAVNNWHAESNWDNELNSAWGKVCETSDIVLWFGQWRKREAVSSFIKWPLRAEIVWAKDCHVGPPSPLAPRDERIWVFSNHAVTGNTFETSVWDSPIIPTWEYKHHKNEKPLSLFLRLLRWLPADSILDPFMGSGTTGVACVRLNRRFIGIEISKEYCDIAVERIKRELSQPRLELEPQPSFEQTKLFDKVE